MPTNIVINNNTFAYPSPGDEPGWGEPATNAMVEVANVLANVQGPDDILETTFSISNNNASPLDVAGLAFNPVTVRSAIIEYSIYRSTTTNELAEKGTIELVYKNGGTVGNKWTISRSFLGDDSGVIITFTDAGQGQYTSTNVSGASYTGIIRFEAKVTNQ